MTREELLNLPTNTEIRCPRSNLVDEETTVGELIIQKINYYSDYIPKPSLNQVLDLLCSLFDDGTYIVK